MSREVCGMCWCTYGDDGRCGCPIEEEVSSKPVAWMRKETDEEGEFLVFLEEEPSWCEAIPLYTHPVKQLSDEEIRKLENALNVCNYRYFGCYAFTDEQWDAFEVLAENARAIIKEITE